MADIVSETTRSRMMSGIRSRNTQPELILRSELHKAGFRFRLHNNNLPGHPDLVFAKYKAVIFVNGCFWHNHNCHLFKWPKTRQDFWKQKLIKNRNRDEKVRGELLAYGWRVGIVWECSLKGKNKLVLRDVVNDCTSWLKGLDKELEICGNE